MQKITFSFKVMSGNLGLKVGQNIWTRGVEKRKFREIANLETFSVLGEAESREIASHM
jgi:hypothetical protein